MFSNSMPVVCLEGVGKCYRIYRNPQDRFKQALRERFGGWLGAQKGALLYREHWALRDVSFTINPGEAVGILGRNGAGKSTLLQVIAGTLAPTTGEVETKGRITALLELGSGFNPEFTGRENVFHNAQILGLTRSETESKIDDILEFAEIGDFVDQPVKTYSSGMMMRLAFAVQTVMDPTILIVDEALAVGDARFQEKCFRKLRELRDNGISILFVTHDFNSVTSFCDRAILMEGGCLVDIGEPEAIVKKYLKVLYSDDRNSSPKATENEAASFNTSTPVSGGYSAQVVENLKKASGRFGNGKVEIIAVGIFTPQDELVDALVSGEKYRIKQRIRVNEDLDYLSTGFVIRTTKSMDIFGVSNKSAGQNVHMHLRRGQVLDIVLDVDLWLSAGDYILLVANAGEDGVQYDCVQSAMQFSVIGTPAIFTTSVVNLCPVISIVDGE
jgi:lipopolysaccharide transport system ATP-binding protein